MIYKILSYIYPFRIKKFFRYSELKIASNYFARKMKKCGENFFVDSGFQLRGPEYMEIGKNFKGKENLILNCIDSDHVVRTEPELIIGDNAYFGANCHIGCLKSIKIGKNFTCGRNVCVIDHNHGDGTLNEKDKHPLERILSSKGGITIGDSVWLGENVVVTSGVKIGNNVVVGANSVVTSDLEENGIYAGVPARLVRIME
jgi:acetyltransferase-like isoleucine patch superfamily enzyme